MLDTYLPPVLQGNLSIDNTIIHVIILAISLYLTISNSKYKRDKRYQYNYNYQNRHQNTNAIIINYCYLKMWFQHLLKNIDHMNNSYPKNIFCPPDLLLLSIKKVNIQLLYWNHIISFDISDSEVILSIYINTHLYLLIISSYRTIDITI